MEKRVPQYPLSKVKLLVEQGAYQVTDTAWQCATKDFGLSSQDQIAACVLALTVSDFYKSMTTIGDSRVWQDVYRPQIDAERAYLKLQIIEDNTIVISLKRL